MRILIVDDDKEIRRHYGKLLMNDGFDVTSVESAEDALDLLEKEHYDMMVLDVQLPGMDGISFTKVIRSSGNLLPILITSNHHTHHDIDDGLLSGADDYMVKPVEEEEFLLRIRAIFRRSRISTSRIITIGSTTIDSTARTVTIRNTQYNLPNKEFDLLFFLLSYPNQVFSREYLLSEIWGPDTDSELATVSVHINRLRNHFSGNEDFTIQTCRGCGYKISTPKRH